MVTAKELYWNNIDGSLCIIMWFFLIRQDILAYEKIRDVFLRKSFTYQDLPQQSWVYTMIKSKCISMTWLWKMRVVSVPIIVKFASQKLCKDILVHENQLGLEITTNLKKHHKDHLTFFVTCCFGPCNALISVATQCHSAASAASY